MANISFTNSALESIHRNNLTRDIISNVVSNSDRSFPGKQSGSTMYSKATSSGVISVVTRHTDQGQLVVTCWVKKGQGSSHFDQDSRYKNASFWKRVWLDFLTTFGL